MTARKAESLLQICECDLLFLLLLQKKKQRVRNDHDGTSPRYSRSLFSSEPVSSFSNRKLNLRFDFFYVNL